MINRFLLSMIEVALIALAANIAARALVSPPLLYALLIFVAIICIIMSLIVPSLAIKMFPVEIKSTKYFSTTDHDTENTLIVWLAISGIIRAIGAGHVGFYQFNDHPFLELAICTILISIVHFFQNEQLGRLYAIRSRLKGQTDQETIKLPNQQTTIINKSS
jgi:hypothetical protein